MAYYAHNQKQNNVDIASTQIFSDHLEDAEIIGKKVESLELFQFLKSSKSQILEITQRIRGASPETLGGYIEIGHVLAEDNLRLGTEFFAWADKSFRYNRAWRLRLIKLYTCRNDYEAAKEWSEGRGVPLTSRDFTVDEALDLVRLWKNRDNLAPPKAPKPRNSLRERLAQAEEATRRAEEAQRRAEEAQKQTEAELAKAQTKINVLTQELEKAKRERDLSNGMNAASETEVAKSQPHHALIGPGCTADKAPGKAMPDEAKIA